MKVLNIIKNIILGILGVVFFAFALAMTILLLNYNDFGVTQFGDTSLILVGDAISSETFKKGDLVLVNKKKLEQINLEDQVFVYKVDSKGRASVELGFVGKKHEEENAIEFQNGAIYSMDFVIGEADKTYEKVGTYLSIIESKWGFLFIVLVPCFLIFVYQVYLLVVEIKYGDDEETAAADDFF